MSSRSPKESSKMIRLYPSLPEDVMENMESVVALDVWLDRVTWVAEDRDRRITDWGQKVIFESEKPKFIYDHLLYQEKLLEVVSMLPSSSIYVMDAPHRRKTTSLANVKYLVHRAVIESMLITLINLTEWSDPCKQTVNQSYQNEETVNQSYPAEGLPDEPYGRRFQSGLNHGINRDFDYEGNNKVYMFRHWNYKNIYDLEFGGDRLSTCPILTELITQGTGALSGLVIPQTFQDEFKRPGQTREKEALATNVLMADSVVRLCLNLRDAEYEDVKESESEETN